MALCLADSLLARRGFDPVDQLERFRRWYREGPAVEHGRCVDIGNADARRPIERFELTGEPYPGDSAPTAAATARS
jgi:ADP-ribosylglycohydrolase